MTITATVTKETIDYVYVSSLARIFAAETGKKFI